MFSQQFRHLLRPCYPQSVSEGIASAEKDGDQLYGRRKAERVVVANAQADIEPELVKHGIDEGVVRLESYISLRTSKRAA